MDGNGDGCGDFAGLRQRLDYLSSLGVNALWLTPFQTSPNRDNGYDVADYYSVDRRFGTGGEFVDFMHEANSRGIRVLVDLVVNHTSERHPWFSEAQRDRDSEFHDWYVWADKRPPNWKSGMVFPGVQEGHVDVRAQGSAVVLPPLLRLPAGPEHGEPARPRGGAADHRLLAPARRCRLPHGRGSVRAREACRRRRSLAEVSSGSGSSGSSCSGVPATRCCWVRQTSCRGVGDLLRRRRRAPHDVQLLGQPAPLLRARIGRRATARAALREDAQAPARRAVGAFPPQPRRARPRPASTSSATRGLRRFRRPTRGCSSTVAGSGAASRRCSASARGIELAYSLLFSLPGTPVLRYGDEIGMGDDLRLKERAAIRTPMQWSDERNGGFSTAEHSCAA